VFDQEGAHVLKGSNSRGDIVEFPSRSFEQLRDGMVVVVGVPWDENSTFQHGSALAPARIREVMSSGSSNLCAESGIDLGEEPRFNDLGDMALHASEDTLGRIEDTIAGLLDRGVYVVALGGDHAITYPIVKSYHKKYEALNILQLDAHPDLYEEYEGNRYSHACPFARIMEEELAVHLVQVGVRTLNTHQRTQAQRFGVKIVEMRSYKPEIALDIEGPLFLSVDMDVLDPAFAPGVSHHEPGGFSTRDVLKLIQGLRGPIVGADIVEFNPKRDPLGITAMAAAKLVKEIAARMIECN
jgi:arginase